jgi:hypothetical protein
MFTWVAETVTAIGQILPKALEAPISYFVGLALLGGIVATLNSLRR